VEPVIMAVRATRALKSGDWSAGPADEEIIGVVDETPLLRLVRLEEDDDELEVCCADEEVVGAVDETVLVAEEVELAVVDVELDVELVDDVLVLDELELDEVDEVVVVTEPVSVD
jgi:hypothetical protein